jgi:hypothetical protein
MSSAVGWRAGRIFTRLGRLSARAPVLETPRALAELYPTLPTWWIPETALGIAAAFLLVIIGAVIAHSAKKIERLLR